MAEFDARRYTAESLMKQLGLIELHGKDGSATDAGCSCIEEKHINLVEGLAEEGVGFSLSAKEKAFYVWLADHARAIRKKIDAEDWTIPPARAIHYLKGENPGTNPGPRAYLPHGLTACEQAHHDVREKLASCIQDLEKKPGAYTEFNPVAICRASVKCPP